jgi:acyl carrier protein
VSTIVPADDLTKQILRLFAEALHVDVPSVDTDLIETGILDSMALVELVFQVESEFQIPISLENADLESFRTVRGIASLLAHPVARSEPSS